MNLVRALLILCLVSSSVYAQASIELFKDASGFDLKEYARASFTQTTDPALAAKSEFEPIRGRGIEFFKGHTAWLRVNISLKYSTKRAVSLVSAASYLDEFKIYQKNNSSWKLVAISGDATEQYLASETYRYPTGTLELNPGENELLIRLETQGPLNLNFTLYDSLDFRQFSATDTIIVALLLGGISMNFFYHIGLRFRVSKREIDIFIFWTFFFFLVQFIFSGIANQLIAPGSLKSFFIKNGLIFSAEITAIMGGVFARSYLELDERNPKILKWFKLSYTLSIANAIFSIFEYNLSSYILLLTNAFLVSLIFYVAIECVVKKYRPATLYLAGWGGLLIGNTATMCLIYGLADKNFFTNWGQLGGGVMLIALVSLALGDKMKMEQLAFQKEIEELNINLEGSNEELRKNIRKIENMSEKMMAQQRNLAEESRKRAESERKLRLELESKFQLFSNTTHHLNNPLNHIMGAYTRVEHEILLLDKFFKAILDDDDSEETAYAKKVVEDATSEALEAGKAISAATKRAADSVKVLRIVSGIDGVDFTVTSLETIWKTFTGICTIKFDEQTLVAMHQFKDLQVYGHPALYAHAFEYIASFIWDHKSAPLLCTVANDSEDGLYHNLIFHTQKIKLTPESSKELCESIEYLLKDYRVRFSLENATQWRLSIPACLDAIFDRNTRIA